MAEDPRELARRLAEEAKNKLKPQGDDPRALAQRLAQEAKQRAVAEPTVGDAPPPSKVSAMQALEREREARRLRQALPPRPAHDPGQTIPSSIDEVVVRNRPSTDHAFSSENTTPGGAAAVVRVVTQAVPGAKVVHQGAVGQYEVATALWRSHLARAQQNLDPQLITTATVLLDALRRIPPGQLVAVRATIGDADWAFWVDRSTERLLATAHPAEVYLAGM